MKTILHVTALFACSLLNAVPVYDEEGYGFEYYRPELEPSHKFSHVHSQQSRGDHAGHYKYQSEGGGSHSSSPSTTLIDDDSDDFEYFDSSDMSSSSGQTADSNDSDDLELFTSDLSDSKGNSAASGSSNNIQSTASESSYYNEKFQQLSKGFDSLIRAVRSCNVYDVKEYFHSPMGVQLYYMTDGEGLSIPQIAEKYIGSQMQSMEHEKKQQCYEMMKVLEHPFRK